jgi:hypothetical protein
MCGHKELIVLRLLEALEAYNTQTKDTNSY